ncbi:MAG: efflux RND transporter permease subunit [Pseudomonadota bacterium]
MSIAEYSIKNRLITWIVVILSIAGGVYAYQMMPRFEDPEFTIRIAQVITEYPGATPEEVANEVSDALEAEIQSMQEVDEITSTSSDGLSIIDVEIKFDFAPDKQALQAVWSKLRNRVDDAVADLPPGAGQPVVNDEYGDVYGLYYLVTGDGFTLKELEDYTLALRKNILTVDGVAKVELSGDQTEAIYVEVSRERAAALGVSISNIFNDLAQQNSVVSAGDAVIGDRRIVIHPTGALDTVSAIENVVVTTGADGDLVYLRDIATVQRGLVDPPMNLVRFNGQEAIGFGVSNVSGANVAKMGEAVRAKIEETIGERPIGVELHEFYHQGDAVNESVVSFVWNVVAALVIVLVVLFVFMGFNSAIIIGFTLLVTIAATLATMLVADIPLHRISLGALIIALGMLVDNAIVVTEGILVGVQKGRKKLDIAVETVGKTKWALLGGTVIGAIAFAPIGFAPGDTGEYAGDLFWVVSISLLYSWIFAITLVPMLADMIFKQASNADADKPDGVMTRLYKSFMRGVLTLRWLVVAGAIGVFAASVVAFQSVKVGFFPASTTPQIAVDYWLPQGTDIAATSLDMARIERELMEFDGVEGVHTIVGSGGLRYMLIYSPENPNAAYGQFLIQTRDFDVIEGLVPQIQTYLDENYPASQARVKKFVLGPSQGSKIEAVFRGPDPRELRRLASEAKAIMITDPEAVGVKTDWRQEIPVFEPVYDGERGRRVGVAREDLAAALETNFSGATIGVYREGDDLIPIISRAPERDRLDFESGETIQVPSSRTGASVPVSETVRGLNVIWRDGRLLREDRVWTLKVQADPKVGVLASAVLARVQPQIEAIALPEGYSLRWDGEIGDSTEANGQLAGTFPLAAMAIVLVMIFLFNALRQPAAIWTIVPLVIVGVVVGLLATNTTYEFMAILGTLSLVGLLIKNAIVLLDQMDLEIREGKPRHDAVIDSAASRVRPVMMGSMTTVLGVIPLFSDVFFASMAVVIAFGLSFGTLITLVVLPAIYALYFGIKSSESVRAQERKMSYAPS